MSGREAAGLGLVTEVADDEADLDARVAAMAARLAGLSPTAVGQGKALVAQSAEIDARASYQLEGTVQDLLMRQPDLAQRFPQALQWIKEGMARAKQ
jgi:enoyl-CoA hydratase/carnithine racemase